MHSSVSFVRPLVLHRLKSSEQRTSRSSAPPSSRSLVPYSRRTALRIRHTHHIRRTRRQSLRAPQQTTSPDCPGGRPNGSPQGDPRFVL